MHMNAICEHTAWKLLSHTATAYAQEKCTILQVAGLLSVVLVYISGVA